MYLQQIVLLLIHALSMGVGLAESEDLLVMSADSEGPTISCEEARLKCAFRGGCGIALQNYMHGCSGIFADPLSNPSHCPVPCQHALIAITSSDEGKDLMRCSCEDENCRESKKRLEVCRPHVLKATTKESVVSCEVAQWICSSDALCSTALEYYHQFCKRMFRGKGCSKRCLNSINILMRQEKALKLSTCTCRPDDTECWEVQQNMNHLCFNKTRQHQLKKEETNEIEPLESFSSSTSYFLSFSMSLFLLLRSISVLLPSVLTAV